MAKIVVASHGTVAQALVGAARAIAGIDAHDVTALALESDENLERLRGRLESTLDGSGDALILVDLFGGTPANAAAWASQGRRIEIISGVNLPMLLEVLGQGQQASVQELARIAKESGTLGIVNVGEALRGG